MAWRCRGQLLHLRGVPPKPVGHAGQRAVAAADRFEGHHPVCHFGQDVGGGEPLDVLIIDPLQEAFTGRPVAGVGRDCEDETVSVDEDGRAGGEVVKRHGFPTAPRRCR